MKVWTHHEEAHVGRQRRDSVLPDQLIDLRIVIAINTAAFTKVASSATYA